MNIILFLIPTILVFGIAIYLQKIGKMINNTNPIKESNTI